MPLKSNYFKCVLCSKCTKPKERATVNKDITKCHKVLSCVKTSKSSSQTTATFSPPLVSLKIPSTSKSHAYCCICKKPGPKLIVISPDVRTATYVDNNILIPSGNRCCLNHICDGHLNDDALCRIKTTDESFVNRTYLLEIMNKMRKKIRESASRRLNFDDSYLSEPDYITMTGLSKINFLKQRVQRRHTTEMPRFLKGEKQLSTEDANMSRLVTKIRWIVESSNARIKTWKYLFHTLPKTRFHLLETLFILCVLCQIIEYAPSWSQCRYEESDQLEAAKMIHLSKMSNTLKEHVETERN
ncbi:unnamed protein product [Mytilus edulis]|uniref:DDE Tnp4 domain-containing protein n=1 Tax=Mytilus edulis TaxID=6550 RepID=A0A8S3QYH6_MYTED|nr:unnamed protein product [Mytilus edulis]